VIDWGTPRPEDKSLTIESYVLDMVPAVIEIMLETSDGTEFSLFGYCMGGLLALLHAATHTDAPLRNLVTLATPVDFTEMGLQSFWAQEPFLDVDRIVDTCGNVPAALMQQSFRMLRPASEMSPIRYVTLWQNVLNDRYVEQYRAFDQWTGDHIPFAGECFRQTTRELVRGNKLATGELRRPAKLEDIRCSFLAVAAESDHVVPLAATRVQPDLVGSTDKEQLIMRGGHMGLAARRKAVQTLWPQVSAWLAARSQTVARTEPAV
jgi:polyhydroxyalkanoate synthase